MSGFSQDSWTELFRSDSRSSRAISRAVAAGKLRSLGRGLYSTNLIDSPQDIIRRNRWRAIGLLAPGAILSYRTGVYLRPEPDGTVYLVGPKRYEADLPGLRIRVAKGPGEQPGDLPMGPPGVLRASRARSLLEGLKAAAGDRGITHDEAEQVLAQTFLTGGEGAVNRLRDEARLLEPALGAQAAFRTVDRIAGVILGSRAGEATAPSAVARLQGRPYDVDRVDLFEVLFERLGTHEPPDRLMPSDDRASFVNISFFDAYFSNFIEGTEFEVDEARAIVFDGVIPPERPLDAHDVLGTHNIVGSLALMRRSVMALPSADAFIDAVRDTHRAIMESRTDKRPGEFKVRPNRAGDTTFVAPDHVLGTLVRGFAMVRAFPHAFQRAAAVMFVLSEVHPFDDGNGRVARAFMNAELVTADQARILIPIVYRDDYLRALRNLSRQRDASALIAVLDFAQRYVAAIDWRDFATAERQLRASNAFLRPSANTKLVFPKKADPKTD